MKYSMNIQINNKLIIDTECSLEELEFLKAYGLIFISFSKMYTLMHKILCDSRTDGFFKFLSIRVY